MEKKYINKQIQSFLNSSQFLRACALCSKKLTWLAHHEKGWRGLSVMHSCTGWHYLSWQWKMTQWHQQEFTKRGEKISFSGEGERGKKGKDKTEEGLIIKHCLSFKRTLHLVSVSRTVSWPKSLQGINFASYHHICGKTSPVPPHDSSILETLTTGIMLQTFEHMQLFQEWNQWQMWLMWRVSGDQIMVSPGTQDLDSAYTKVLAQIKGYMQMRYRIWHTKVSTIFTCCCH